MSICVMIFIGKVKSGGKMFGKLQQCVGKNVFIKFWKDGKIVFYEGKLDKVVDYRYILLDKKNYLLFLAANGAIASIKCDGKIVYETIYDHETYEPIEENIEEELEKRELDCFDDNYKVIKEKSTLEYFLKRGRELLIDHYYVRWEKFVKANIKNRYHIVKAVVDLVNMVQNGMSYYVALTKVLGESFSISIVEMEEINDIILRFFSDSVYEYTDYAVYMLHFAGVKKIEENQNMKQLMNTQNVYVSLAK